MHWKYSLCPVQVWWIVSTLKYSFRFLFLLIQVFLKGWLCGHFRPSAVIRKAIAAASLQNNPTNTFPLPVFSIVQYTHTAKKLILRLKYIMLCMNAEGVANLSLGSSLMIRFSSSLMSQQIWRFKVGNLQLLAQCHRWKQKNKITSLLC